VNEFHLRLDELHNDSTSISFFRELSSRGDRRHFIAAGPRLPSPGGHSKAHRPDLKQLLYILTVTEGRGACRCTSPLPTANLSDEPHPHSDLGTCCANSWVVRTSCTWPTASWPAPKKPGPSDPTAEGGSLLCCLRRGEKMGNFAADFQTPGGRHTLEASLRRYPRPRKDPQGKEFTGCSSTGSVSGRKNGRRAKVYRPALVSSHAQGRARSGGSPATVPNKRSQSWRPCGGAWLKPKNTVFREARGTWTRQWLRSSASGRWNDG